MQYAILNPKKLNKVKFNCLQFWSLEGEFFKSWTKKNENEYNNSKLEWQVDFLQFMANTAKSHHPPQNTNYILISAKNEYLCPLDKSNTP